MRRPARRNKIVKKKKKNLEKRFKLAKKISDKYFESVPPYSSGGSQEQFGSLQVKYGYIKIKANEDSLTIPAIGKSSRRSQRARRDGLISATVDFGGDLLVI